MCVGNQVWRYASAVFVGSLRWKKMSDIITLILSSPREDDKMDKTACVLMMFGIYWYCRYNLLFILTCFSLIRMVLDECFTKYLVVHFLDLFSTPKKISKIPHYHYLKQLFQLTLILVYIINYGQYYLKITSYCLNAPRHPLKLIQPQVLHESCQHWFDLQHCWDIVLFFNKYT